MNCSPDSIPLCERRCTQRLWADIQSVKIQFVRHCEIATADVELQLRQNSRNNNLLRRLSASYTHCSVCITAVALGHSFKTCTLVHLYTITPMTRQIRGQLVRENRESMRDDMMIRHSRGHSVRANLLLSSFSYLSVELSRYTRSPNV